MIIAPAMGFRLYQHDVAPENEIPIPGDSDTPVFVDFRDETFDVSLAWSDGYGQQRAVAARLFINERDGDQGRELIVVWDPSRGRGVSVARDRAATVWAGTVRWKVTEAAENIPRRELQREECADLQRADGVAGPRIQMKTSTCGNDTYIITASNGRRPWPDLAHLVVSVRKRVRYHYVQMQRATRGAPPFNIDAPLAEATELLRRQFGIVLERIDVSTVAHRTRLTSGALHRHIRIHGDRRRTLWIVACDTLVYTGVQSRIGGLGGSNLVAVAVEEFADARDPRAIVQALVHEFGHAFGAVPSGASWEDHPDPQRPDVQSNHCRNRNCVMYYAGDRRGNDRLWSPNYSRGYFLSDSAIAGVRIVNNCALELYRNRLDHLEHNS